MRPACCGASSAAQAESDDLKRKDHSDQLNQSERKIDGKERLSVELPYVVARATSPSSLIGRKIYLLAAKAIGASDDGPSGRKSGYNDGR